MSDILYRASAEKLMARPGGVEVTMNSADAPPRNFDQDLVPRILQASPRSTTSSTRSKPTPGGPSPQHDRFDDSEQIVDDEPKQSNHDQERIDLGGLEVSLGLDHQRPDAGQ